MAFISYYRIELREIPQQYEGQRLLKVVRRSDMLLRKEVERIAWFFRREFDYDLVQFTKTDKTPYTAYLLANEGNEHPRVWVGACCFRARDYADLGQQVEALQWVWIHPYHRSKGLLKGLWPTLCENHGDFIVEEPLSPSMKQFLLKHSRGSVFHPIYEGKKPNVKKMKAQLALIDKSKV